MPQKRMNIREAYNVNTKHFMLVKDNNKIIQENREKIEKI